jgi:hypothetical protein
MLFLAASSWSYRVDRGLGFLTGLFDKTTKACDFHVFSGLLYYLQLITTSDIRLSLARWPRWHNNDHSSVDHY